MMIMVKVLKKALAILVCLGMLLGLMPITGMNRAYAETEEVALTNAGFEEDLQIPGWTVEDSSGSIAVTDAVYNSDVRSLEMVDTGASDSPLVRSGMIPVDEGDKIGSSLYANVSAYDGNAPYVDVVYSIWYCDSNGNRTSQVYGKDIQTNGGWVRYTGNEITIPAGVAGICMAMYGAGGGECRAYFDDVTVTKNGSSVTLTNPGFEEAMSIPGWNRIYGDESEFSISDAVYNSGAHSLKVVDGASDAGKWMYSDTVEVNAGDRLTAAAQVKVDAGALELCIKYQDDDYNDVGQYADTTAGVGDWSRQSVSGTVPEGATKALIFIYSGMGAITTAYVDDVALSMETAAGPQDQGTPNVLVNYDCSDLQSLADHGWMVGTPSAGAYATDSAASTGSVENYSFKDVPEGQVLFYMDGSAGTDAVDAFKIVDARNTVGTKPWKLELDMKFNDIMDVGTPNVVSGFSIMVNTGERVNRINFGGDNVIRVETAWDDPYPQCAEADLQGEIQMTDGQFHHWSIEGDGRGGIILYCDEAQVAEFTGIAFMDGYEPGIQFINYNSGIASGCNEIYFDNIKFTVFEEENAVINLNFESDANGDGTIPGWTQWYGSTGFSIAADDKYYGKQSLLVNDGDTGTSFWLLSNTVPVDPGDELELAGHAKVVSGSVQVNVAYLDDNGEMVTYTENEISSPTNEWARTEKSVTVPAEASQACIFIYSGLSSTCRAYVDELKLQKVENPAPRNMDFEEPIYVAGKIPGWNIKYGDASNFSVSGEQKHSGSYSLKVVDINTDASKWLYSNKTPVEPGQKCRVDAWAYFESGNGVELCIRYFDENGDEIGSYPDTTINSPVGSWNEYGVEGVAPQGAAMAAVFIYSGYGAVCTAYFDDISFSVENGTGIIVGAPIDLGEVVKAPLTVGAAIAETASGENELYFALNGTPSTFYAVNAETGEVSFSQQVPGMTHLYGIAQGSDKNIYFCGIDDGILYRYLPAEKRIENLGDNPSNNWIWDLAASSDGKIYGATYPGSRIFEYDIATGEFTDIGSAVEGQEYARGLDVTDDYIYVGVGTTDALIRIDRETGEKTEISTPYSGQTRMAADVWAYNGKLFVRDETSTLLVLDEATGNFEKQLTFRAKISPPSPYDDNLIYYYKQTDRSLYSYNMSTKTESKITGVPQLPLSEPMVLQWVTPSGGEKAGKPVLAMMMQFTEYMLYDPEDNWFETVPMNVEGQGLEIQSIEKGADGKLYIGGYQKATSIYDIGTKQLEHSTYDFPQAEGIGFLNGKTYYGTYGGAVIYAYDPSKPFAAGTNPGVVNDVGDEQDRPFALTSGDDKLFIGTVSEYGIQGGALTVYDEKTNTWSTYRNVVEDQSIIGLAYKDGKLYGGTSLWGGLGVDPTQDEAKLFVWDVANGEKIDEFTISIPGIDETPKMIGGLSFGPDGLLWGVVAGSVFAMDPDTKEIVKSKVIFGSDYVNNSTWRPYYLRWGDDGLLYTTAGRNIVVLNPETMAYDVLKTGVSLAALGDNGNLYYASGSKLMELPLTRESRYPGSEKAAAARSAINAIDMLPGYYNITLSNKTAVQNARSLVNAAKEKGTADADIANLNKLALCENRITALESSNDPTPTPTPTPIATATPTPTPSSTPAPTSTAKPASTSTPAPTPTLMPQDGTIAKTPEIEDGTATVSISAEDLARALESLQADADGVKKVTVEVGRVDGAAGYVQQLPAELLSTGDGKVKLELKTPVGTIVIPDNMFETGNAQNAENIGISIGYADISGLNDRIREEIGNKPVIELGAAIDGKPVSWNNPKTPVEVSIDYVPTADELKDPEHIVIWYIDGNGNILSVPSGRYDPATQKVTFTTTHFSRYAVAYVHKTFGDITKSYARKQIEVLASKGVINGTSAAAYSPKNNITRADFIVLLVKALGLTAGIDSSFSDIKSTDYFYEAAGVAKKLGIAEGVGNGRFNPGDYLSRQDMMVLTRRALAVAGKVSSTADASVLDRFGDASAISDYAAGSIAILVKDGIIAGDGSRMNPLSNTTREEAAVLIYNIYNR